MIMSKIFKSIREWRDFRKQTVFMGKTIGFVPTMGNLHDGHRELLERSVKENDLTVLSIFVNPAQFDNKMDLEKYPRTQDADVLFAREAKVDFILIPDYDSLYPDNYTYKVQECEISGLMEGRSRPGHFDGMLTVVLKLFQIVKATRSYFGEKDYQQLQLVRGLVDAFFLDTEIIAHPTVRDANGFALSSRNGRLSSDEYDRAIKFPKLLGTGRSADAIGQDLSNLGIEVDYIEDWFGRRFGAIKIGGVRLIDNFKMEK